MHSLRQFHSAVILSSVDAEAVGTRPVQLQLPPMAPVKVAVGVENAERVRVAGIVPAETDAVVVIDGDRAAEPEADRDTVLAAEPEIDAVAVQDTCETTGDGDADTDADLAALARADSDAAPDLLADGHAGADIDTDADCDGVNEQAHTGHASSRRAPGAASAGSGDVVESSLAPGAASAGSGDAVETSLEAGDGNDDADAEPLATGSVGGGVTVV